MDNPRRISSYPFQLPDEDSNLDKQNQNLSYCHYTIGQSLSFSAEGDLAYPPTFKKECKNKG